MKSLRKGKRSFQFDEAPVIAGWASVAGKKESEGPLGHTFDATQTDPYFGQKTWEQAESRMQLLALENLKIKTGIRNEEIGVLFSGDLLNQCVGSSFTLRNLSIPHIGLYGACSTMAESLLMASMAVGGGFTDNAIAMTSSHFASSERQYRFPLGYGGQRPPTAQWTVTGSGAVLLKNHGNGPRITGGTIGTVTDLGVTDANNMGSAMAPAALETICAHFADFNTSADDYDLIVTGDLGQLGKEVLLSTARDRGVYLGGKLEDCGTLIFDLSRQDVHCGGSGCGCSAVVLCGYLLEQLKTGKLKRILFCGTGALLSPTSVQQGLPISGVCHAVSIYGG
jgi:stage V sporulation protein AD